MSFNPGSGISLMVPLIAIILALITKNAYVSLIVSTFFGALIYCGFDFMKSCSFIVSAMEESISGNNISVLVFLVMLGTIVVLINKTNVSKVYAGLIGNKIKTKKGVLLLTSVLSSIFFLDDYFNCLTTGSIITPLAKHKKIFPGKIAHVIHSTAIPVCILMPISSWGAAISSTLTDSGAPDGLALFNKIIPYNFYAIVTIFSVIVMSIFDISFFTMKKEENKYIKRISRGNLTFNEEDSKKRGEILASGHNLVKDFILKLVVPLVFLIVACVFSLLYTGGITKGNSFLKAVSCCDSSKGLLLGAIFTFAFMYVLYVVVLKAVKFSDFFCAIPEGLKEMAPAIVVLILAWTLGTITSKYLKIGDFIANIFKSNLYMLAWVPVILFFFSAVMSVSTGTSWGTFAILIPVAYPVLKGQEDYSVLLVSLAAILSGAAFGDNASPISDTTIMSATSANCEPLVHSFTQLPYALVNAVISAFCFALSGFVKNVWVLILIALFISATVLFFAEKVGCKKAGCKKA